MRIGTAVCHGEPNRQAIFCEVEGVRAVSPLPIQRLFNRLEPSRALVAVMESVTSDKRHIDCHLIVASVGRYLLSVAKSTVGSRGQREEVTYEQNLAPDRSGLHDETCSFRDPGSFARRGDRAASQTSCFEHPVVEKGAIGGPRLIGFISQADCLEHLSNEIFFGNPSVPQTVQTMMKRHPVCVTSETDLFALASIFVTHQFRHLPVVDNDRLVGMVSRRDVLEELDRFYRERIEDSSFERSPPDLHEVANLRFVARTR